MDGTPARGVCFVFLAKRGAFCLLPRSLRSPDFERGGRPGARPAVAGLLEIDRSCV